MGQKVNPHGMRVGVIKGWNAKWYADKKDLAKYIKEDKTVRDFIKKEYYDMSISEIVIERNDDKFILDIYTSKQGALIGENGATVDKLKASVQKLISEPQKAVVNIMEVKKPDMNAQLVAENIAAQLERRVSFRRAMRQCMGRAMRAGAKGIKTMVSGRLDGAEIARCEHYHEGSIPLHTLRANIDYGFAEAHTTFGTIGVKVWVNLGEVLPRAKVKPIAASEGGNSNVNA